MRIAFATWSGEPDLTADDTLAKAALESLGHSVAAVPWDGRGTIWRQYAVVVLRSTWNYHHASDAFLHWLDTLEAAGVHVLNPISLLRWNAHKGYLLDLAAAGIRIPGTRLVQRNPAPGELQALESLPWAAVVIKPAVSANAYRTERVMKGSFAELPGRVANLASHGDVLVQELVPEVADGEHSIVFFNGEFSHAVLKQPGPGDFRVQEKFGGTSVPAWPDQELMRTCRRILDALPAAPAYVRLDVVRTPGGSTLMEVEAIEPTLFLASAPGAAERFARGIVARAAEHARC